MSCGSSLTEFTRLSAGSRGGQAGEDSNLHPGDFLVFVGTRGFLIPFVIEEENAKRKRQLVNVGYLWCAWHGNFRTHGARLRSNRRVANNGSLNIDSSILFLGLRQQVAT